MTLDSDTDKAEMLARLGELATDLANAELRASQTRALRDKVIKQCREARISIPKIAEAAKTSETTVKSVLR